MQLVLAEILVDAPNKFIPPKASSSQKKTLQKLFSKKWGVMGQYIKLIDRRIEAEIEKTTRSYNHLWELTSIEREGKTIVINYFGLIEKEKNYFKITTNTPTEELNETLILGRQVDSKIIALRRQNALKKAGEL